MEDPIPLHLFTQDDASSIPFQVVELSQRTEYDVSIPHRHNYYEIFVFFKGGGHHEIDFHKFPIEDCSIHYVSPGQVHQVSRSLESHGCVILFSRDFYSFHLEEKDTLFDLPFLNNNAVMPIVNLEPNEMNLVKPIIDALIDESKKDALLKERVLQNYLQLLLLFSKRYFKENGVYLETNQLLKNFKIALEKNFTKLHKVKDYSVLLNSTEKTLNETVKKHTGSTASDMIYERIILEAKRLIKHSELSNKEIAHILNYDDPAHFSKFFKSKTGFSPSEFRDNN